MIQDLSTKNLIKIIPLDYEFKSHLLENFDKLSKEQQVEIDEMVWDAYDAIYQVRLDTNIEIAMQDETTKLDEGFYNRMKKKTEEELQQNETKIAENFDLSETRIKLEEVIKNYSSENKPD